MFDDEDDEFETEEESEISPARRIIKKAFKILAFTIVFGVNMLLILRMLMSGTPSSMKAVSPNEKLASAYAAALDADEEFRAVAQVSEVFTHEQDEEEGYNYGYFAVLDPVFFPSAEQAQIVFRYNDSTLRYMQEDYELDFSPDKNEDWFDVTLRIVIDRTPENKKDNGETYWEDLDAVKIIRIKPTAVESTTRPLYSYRRFTFDGVPSIEEGTNVLAVYVDVYYKDDVNYDRRAYGSMRIYTGGVEIHKYKLSGKELRSLKELIDK